jgi:hypothetical protein
MMRLLGWFLLLTIAVSVAWIRGYDVGRTQAWVRAPMRSAPCIDGGYGYTCETTPAELAKALGNMDKRLEAACPASVAHYRELSKGGHTIPGDYDLGTVLPVVIPRPWSHTWKNDVRGDFLLIDWVLNECIPERKEAVK